MGNCAAGITGSLFSGSVEEFGALEELKAILSDVAARGFGLVVLKLDMTVLRRHVREWDGTAQEFVQYVRPVMSALIGTPCSNDSIGIRVHDQGSHTLRASSSGGHIE